MKLSFALASLKNSRKTECGAKRLPIRLAVRAASFALLAGTAAWAADPVPLDLKTGQWEYTVTTQMTGMPQAAAGKQMPQIPPETLAKLPPDQRAKIEAAMKQASGMASGQPTTTTSKNCIKKED